MKKYTIWVQVDIMDEKTGTYSQNEPLDVLTTDDPDIARQTLKKIIDSIGG